MLKKAYSISYKNMPISIRHKCELSVLILQDFRANICRRDGGTEGRREGKVDV